MWVLVGRQQSPSTKGFGTQRCTRTPLELQWRVSTMWPRTAPSSKWTSIIPMVCSFIPLSIQPFEILSAVIVHMREWPDLSFNPSYLTLSYGPTAKHHFLTTFLPVVLQLPIWTAKGQCSEYLLLHAHCSHHNHNQACHPDFLGQTLLCVRS